MTDITIPVNTDLATAIAAAQSYAEIAEGAADTAATEAAAGAAVAVAPVLSTAQGYRDAAETAKTSAEAALANALATERRIRAQDLGDFADDAAAIAWAAAQSPVISIFIGSSYWNTTTKIKRICSATSPSITFVDEDADAQTQRTNAAASAVAAAAVQSDLNNRFLSPRSTDPSYVGGSPPWVNGARYYNTLREKERVWKAVGGVYGWHDYDEEAQTAAALATQIQVGLSWDEYTVDGVSAFDQGAVISFPKGLFVLNGNRVSLDTLLAASTAQKRILDPAGNYVTSGANTLAQDWSTGRRRLLAEAIGATNLIKHSLDFTQTAWLKTLGGTGSAPAVTLNYGAAPDGSNTSTRVVFNAGAGTSGSDMSLLQQNFTMVNGSSYAHGVFMKAAAGTQIVVRGAGLASYTKITATGAWQRVPVVEVAAGTTGTFEIGVRQVVCGAINATADVEFWHCGVEFGTTLSSVIPSGASETARAADILTAASGLLALLTTAGASFFFVMRGKLAVPSRTSLIGAGNTGATLLLYSAALADAADAPGNSLLCAPGSGDLFGGDFGVAVSSVVGQPMRRLSANGHATVSDNHPLFAGTETSLQIAGGAVNYPGNLFLDELVVVPILASEAGVQAQSRVYS